MTLDNVRYISCFKYIYMYLVLSYDFSLLVHQWYGLFSGIFTGVFRMTMLGLLSHHTMRSSDLVLNIYICVFGLII